MKDAAELVAVAHVADRHDVGTDNAGQLYAWLRLADDAGRDQVIMPTVARTRVAHGEQLSWTFMLTVCDSFDEFTPGLHGRTQNHVVVHEQWTGTAVRA